MLNSKETIKVAMVEPIGSHGGMDYYDFGLCAGLIKAGCQVNLFTCDETRSPNMVGLRVTRIFKGVYGKAKIWLKGIFYFIAITKLVITLVLRGYRLCHYHVFHGSLAEIALLVLLKCALRKIVLTVHDVESFENSVIHPVVIGHFYQYAHKLIAHNQVSKKEIIVKLGIPSNNIVIIPHGNYLHAKTETIDPVDAKKKLGLEASKKVVLFFGQIKDVKGLDVLLEAMPRTIADQPDTVLLIAGRPWKTEFSRYEDMIIKYGIKRNCISHIRYIPNEEVPIYFGACDVVVIPYRRIYQSGVVLMSMSYGKSVLVSDIPGMVEIVRDGDNGFTFKNGDAKDLSEKLCQVLRNDEMRNKIAASALSYVKEKHDWDKVGILTAELYKGLIA